MEDDNKESNGMTSFFQSIRSYFKHDYDGRYLSLLLREIAVHEPRSMAALLDLASSKSRSRLWPELKAGVMQDLYVIQCEFRHAKNRQADLAFLSAKQPRLLVEVKEYDDVRPENGDQISDYLVWAEKGVGFIYIYRFTPEQEYYQRLLEKQNSSKPVATISYDEIYRALRKEGAPLGNLLCTYLEDIGVGVYRELGKDEGRSLSYMLVQMLGFPHNAGMRRLQSDAAIRSIPKFFETFLGNVEVIGENVRRANMELFPKRFNRRFFVEPELNYKKLRKGLASDGLEDIDTIDSKFIECGHLYFAATGSLNVPDRASKDWGYRLTLGYALGLEKGSDKISSYIYGATEGYGGLYIYDEVKLSAIAPSEDAALRTAAKVVSELRRKVLAKKGLTAPARKAFQQLKAPRVFDQTIARR